MRVYHPQGMYNNLPPENVFLAADEMGNEIGVGYIIRVMQPNVFPDRPVNLFISMECQPVARYMLFGALVARARQMRDENPPSVQGTPAPRSFTCTTALPARIRRTCSAWRFPRGTGKFP